MWRITDFPKNQQFATHRRYCEDWQDPNPLYLQDSPFGGPVVPPAFMAGLTGFQLLCSRYNARATIGAKTEHENINPWRVGKKLITRSATARTPPGRASRARVSNRWAIRINSNLIGSRALALSDRSASLRSSSVFC